MKNLLVVIIIAGAIMFTGCSTNQPEPFVVINECVIDSEIAPNWACGIVTEHFQDKYTDVGSAPARGASNNFIRKSALTNARGNLAQQLATRIKDRSEEYENISPDEQSFIVDYVGTQVSQQTANLMMKNSKQLAWWQHPNSKEVYVLVGVDKNVIKTEINSSYLREVK